MARLLAGLDSEVRSLPDERHLLDRSHGFRKLRAAFDLRTGGARARARELERRQRLDAVLERHEIQQRDLELEQVLARSDGEAWLPQLPVPPEASAEGDQA